MGTDASSNPIRLGFQQARSVDVFHSPLTSVCFPRDLTQESICRPALRPVKLLEVCVRMRSIDWKVFELCAFGGIDQLERHIPDIH